MIIDNAVKSTDLYKYNIILACGQKSFIYLSLLFTMFMINYLISTIFIQFIEFNTLSLMFFFFFNFYKKYTIYTIKHNKYM